MINVIYIIILNVPKKAKVLKYSNKDNYREIHDHVWYPKELR